jgi:hypothetical protein
MGSPITRGEKPRRRQLEKFWAWRIRGLMRGRMVEAEAMKKRRHGRQVAAKAERERRHGTRRLSTSLVTRSGS